MDWIFSCSMASNKWAVTVCGQALNYFSLFVFLVSLANGQLNGSGSKGSHKEDGSLHSQGLHGNSKYGEDSPAKKRCVYLYRSQVLFDYKKTPHGELWFLFLSHVYFLFCC